MTYVCGRWQQAPTTGTHHIQGFGQCASTKQSDLKFTLKEYGLHPYIASAQAKNPLVAANYARRDICVKKRERRNNDEVCYSHLSCIIELAVQVSTVTPTAQTVPVNTLTAQGGARCTSWCSLHKVVLAQT